MTQGIAIAQYFSGASLVGTRETYLIGYAREDGTSHSGYWPHTAYFCPMCGEIWGRELLLPQFSYTPIPKTLWVTETRRCVRHGDGKFLTGKPLEKCSHDLIKREFTILLNAQGI